MALHELQRCSEGWIVPCVGLFLERPRPKPDVPDRLLSLIEETASAVWLLQGEHEALMGRLRELSGPREAMLPEDVAATFARAAGPSASLDIVHCSLAARIALLEAHAQDVDAHTRLVLRKHVIVAKSLIAPTLASVAAEARRIALPRRVQPEATDDVCPPISKDELMEQYRSFLPFGPRAHPDTFLAIELLRCAQTQRS
jgi:hypothetical protein